MAKILIVEDNQINFELANELLIRAGHFVVKAENMQECVSAVNFYKPDLILMDLHLPDMKGTEITKILKNNPETRDVPVVAFTAMVMDFDKDEAFKAGCVGFIAKPISVNTFVTTVEDFIKKEANKMVKKEADTPENNPEKPPKALSKKYQRHNILVVDDSILNADILKETLEQIGQNVEIAYNGRDVFKKVENKKFDLVLLDIMMPDISGFSILEELRAKPETADLPVIFVSALDQTSAIVKGFDLGSCEYIIKPYKIEELKARVLSILKINDLQNRLLAEKRVLDLIFGFSEDGMILLNPDFCIVSCNDMFLEWIKKEKDEVLGKKFCEFIRCKKDDCTLTSSEGYSCFELEIETSPEGGEMLFEAKCSKITPTKDESGGGYVMVLRDITARKQIEAQKETFVATLTHDLKTPVRAQIRALEMMIAGKFGELQSEQAQILNETLNSNKYMFGMLDNLLSTYRYEDGNVVINRQNVDINDLIKSCYAELRHLAEDKNQHTDLNFEEECLNIHVDPVEIKRVILNLISNALNYTDEKGEICISTTKEGENCIICFRDNGRGISKDEISSLFNKFTSYSKRFRQVGTGLGLYLSKKIVEKHGGTISVDSEEGKGSCFTVSLPV
jgi:CheY-like chemotaxis protein